MFGDKISKIEYIKGLFNVFWALDGAGGWLVAIIEMLIIAFAIYHILSWIKKSGNLGIIGLFVLVIVFLSIASIFEFSVILFLTKYLFIVAIICAVIIFQNDIRRAIDTMGRQNKIVVSKLIPTFNSLSKRNSETTIQEIAEAVFDMGKVKTGALIVIEGIQNLQEVEKTGINIDGQVTKQLLINIFEKNTPLHDGAVLIVKDRVKAATCYLPLSQNSKIPKELGTRHRAAMGISEISDSMTVVVSEETGHVSLFENGHMKLIEEKKELINELINGSNTVENQDESKKKILEVGEE